MREITIQNTDFSTKGSEDFLATEALRLRYAYLFDPYLAVSVSKIDPLPFQIEAVYEYALKLPRVRFMIADDPGAGKTIMAGLIIKELKLRGLAKRILVVVPGHLKDQWIRELKEKFQENFEVFDRNLTEQDKRKVKEKVEGFKKGTKELLRRPYRLVLYARKERAEEIDLGMPVRGIERIDKEVYDRLRSENVIYEKLTPHYSLNQFLTTREYIPTKPLLEVFYKTPGMPRLSSKDVLKNSISEGVEKKLFSLGVLSEDGPVCKYFGTLAEPSFDEGEILIKKELCIEEKEGEIEHIPSEKEKPEVQINQPTGSASYGSSSTTGLVDTEHGSRSIKEFRLRVKVPTWRLPDVARTLRLIPEKFEEVELRLEVISHGGKVTKQFLQDKI